ncbi:hypothetical protein B0T22DRAFT_484107 [Podospora appendiculata]|uniref:Alpha/beta hydrolase fold-3 domain-containing protein n=1 Tax=Podospora appendiculata TaxID=314037 RepID=A0AAE0X431_9PEZI|nr:hypothetical protein B0T22DRAFT_484107 [Podospora appendiculata]
MKVPFFTYLRLKAIATILRGLLLVQGFVPLRRDRLLAQKIPARQQLRLHDVEDVLCWVASQSTLFDTARVGVSCFVPDHAMRADPRVSSSKADAADFPPAVASLACEGDIFSPEALALAERLDDRRRRVLGRNLEGVHHGFDKGARRGTREWERREEAYELAIQILKDGLKV